MAITEIPELVKAAPGDLIRSQDVNNVQRQMRNSVRAHRHMRLANAPPDDAASVDLARQVATEELADGAVTAPKLADGSIPGAALANGAVTGLKLAANAVGTTKLQDAAVTSANLQANAVARANVQNGAVARTELDLEAVATVSQSVPANQTVATDTHSGVTNALASVFFPVASLTSVSSGIAEVEATFVYRRTPTSPGTGVGLRMRVRNGGTASATVNWRVLTFGPFGAPPYGYGSLAAIGGRLL